MTINSRRKGRAGEQEIAAVLREALGLDVHRDWATQAARGGRDLIGLPGFSVEVKRYHAASLGDRETWWSQAQRQARANEQPVVAYRVDRQDWRFIVPHPETDAWAFTRDIGLQAFVALVRERGAA